MKNPFLLLTLLLSLGQLSLSARSPVADTVVAPDHHDVVTMGRFTDDFRFGWTASGVRLRFKGTSASVALELAGGRKAAMQVVVDGQPTETLMVTRERTLHPLATGLPAGEHTVELWKRSEGQIGQVKFLGFQLGEGGSTLPLARSERKILAIGDSITCGYGNEAKALGEGNTVENENGYMAYAPIAARQLDAELTMVCWSGRGIYRNRSIGDDRKGVLPELVEQTLPLEKAPAWNHGAFSPEVIVINLGTNDLARGDGDRKPPLRKEDYLGAYRAFLGVLRERHPKAKFIVAIGPMASEPIAGWLAELASEDPNVHALEFERKQGAEYRGGHWHPSVVMHKLMAETLASKIREITGWK